MTTPNDASRGDAPRHVLSIRDLRQTPSLDEAIRSVVADIAADRRLRRLPEVDVSVDPGSIRAGAVDNDAIAACLTPIVAIACDAACAPVRASDGPRLREVTITAVDTLRGLEIEVADSGPGPDFLRPETLGVIRTAVERLGGGLVVTACPEGGAAVTLSLPCLVAHGQSMRPAA